MKHALRIGSTSTAVLLLLWPASLWGAASLLPIDRRALVSRADLTYNTPVTRPEEGMPIGNGRTGSLVWTTPSALHFQINRVDVHAMDSSTASFPRADSDYGYGCASVDVNVAGAEQDVFAGAAFRQHLSVYDGLMTAAGGGLTARVVAWPDGDVLAVELDDQRARPDSIHVDLRMLRFQAQYEKGRNFRLQQDHAALFRTAGHTVLSTLGIDQGLITLTQQFREEAFYDSSAVAIGVIGRESRARYLNPETVQLSVPAAKGRFTILIGSAESRKAGENTAGIAVSEVRRGGDFAKIQQAAALWWSRYWERGLVHLHSASRQADLVEANYTYYLYLMASSSRGAYPPHFGGMLWFTDQDLGRWGSQYWFANTYAYYSNLMPANRPELMEPFFQLYEGELDNARAAAKQQWDAEGIWIPETEFFNGPERLGEEIGNELRDLMLVRKPWKQRSPRFDWFANTKNRHESRWNFRADGEWNHGYYEFKQKSDADGSGAFGHTSHILGVAGRVGNLAWQRYRYTGDEQWLRYHAYPFIKGSAEFYAHFPNLRKDTDGIYHLEHTNSGESAWNSRDAAYEVAVMRMVFPLAIRASTILGIDAKLRPRWQEINDHLPPAPAARAGAVGSQGGGDRPFGAFVYGGPGAIPPIGPEPELKARFLGFNALASFIDAPGSGGAQILRNRLRLREGPGVLDAEHIAGLSSGIHSTLLNSHPESIGDEPIELLKGWPKDWDTAFTLLARGGFVVSAAQKSGEIRFLEIESQLGGVCQVMNPWGERAVAVYRDGAKEASVEGRTLELHSKRGERIVLAPVGVEVGPVRLMD